MNMVCKCGGKEFFTEEHGNQTGFTAPLVVSGKNGSRRTRYDFSIMVSR